MDLLLYRWSPALQLVPAGSRLRQRDLDGDFDPVLAAGAREQRESGQGGAATLVPHARPRIPAQGGSQQGPRHSSKGEKYGTGYGKSL
jgi:hypothetical protein